MYSIVLMMAMSGSADIPAAHNGCNGCAGYACAGCNGNGCAGYACGGCNGHTAHASCCGCNGGKSGFLGHLFNRSKGCNGCDGGHGCHGYACGGGHGCNGYACGGGHGCNGGGCWGGHAGCVGGAPASEPAPAPKEKTAGAQPAHIQVSVPADAKVFIEDKPTTSTSASRLFVTPALEGGLTYTYSVRVELVRDGRTISDRKVVNVQPGETTKVSFDGLGNATAGAAPSTFAIAP